MPGGVRKSCKATLPVVVSMDQTLRCERFFVARLSSRAVEGRARRSRGNRRERKLIVPGAKSRGGGSER